MPSNFPVLFANGSITDKQFQKKKTEYQGLVIDLTPIIYDRKMRTAKLLKSKCGVFRE